ncbi:uncharacterized protein METZ01_LOCUS229336, partial [marine metagenome]
MPNFFIWSLKSSASKRSKLKAKTFT